MIVQYPAEILTTVCAPVTDFATVKQVVADLEREMNTPHGRTAIGLSAPQVNHALRVFLLDTKGIGANIPRIYVNPEVTWMSEVCDERNEGCMSLPRSFEVSVKRPIEVQLIASTPKGESIMVRLRGLAARAALHELDHLNGKTLIDYASRQMRRAVMRQLEIE